MNLIKLSNVSKSYGYTDMKTAVLKDINIEINKGEMIAIMGPSGSGKSTLLNILGCLDTFDTGEYLLNGNNVSKKSRNELAKIRNKTFGFVVQYFALIEDHTIYQNVIIPLEYSKNKNRKEKVLNMLKKLKIEEHKDKIPSQLSGGQQQRTAIARALINNPEIILADEPTGALDSKTGSEILDIFTELNKEGKTIIIVTHDEKVSRRCSKIINLEDGSIKRSENI